MTLEQAKQAVADGQRIREEAAREKQRLDAEATKRAQASEEKRKREFVEQYLDGLVKMLDARIAAAAHCGTPSAEITILDVAPRAQEPPRAFEIALFSELRAHYESMGFAVQKWDPGSDRWGGIQVSGWLERPCG